MRIVAIKLRGDGRDEFGCPQYIWATKEQARRIMDSQYTDDRDLMFQLGDHYIRANDIAIMKEMELEDAKNSPSFKPYIYKALERERQDTLEAESKMTLHGKLMKQEQKKFLASHKL